MRSLSVRLLFAPGWARLLVRAAPLALLIAAVYLLIAPWLTRTLGWWGPVWVVALSLAATGFGMALTAPARRALLGALSGLDAGQRERAAEAVYGGLYDNQRLLDHRLVGPGGPPPSAYRDWADRLRSYRAQVSAPDVAPRVREIAELAARAAAQVSDAQADDAGGSADDTVRRQAAYRSVAAQIAEADNALLAACHPAS